MSSASILLLAIEKGDFAVADEWRAVHRRYTESRDAPPETSHPHPNSYASPETDHPRPMVRVMNEPAASPASPAPSRKQSANGLGVVLFAATSLLVNIMRLH